MWTECQLHKRKEPGHHSLVLPKGILNYYYCHYLTPWQSLDILKYLAVTIRIKKFWVLILQMRAVKRTLILWLHRSVKQNFPYKQIWKRFGTIVLKDLFLRIKITLKIRYGWLNDCENTLVYLKLWNSSK